MLSQSSSVYVHQLLKNCISTNVFVSYVRKILKTTGTYLHDKLYSNVGVNHTERETLEEISYSNELSVYTSDLCAFLLALSASTEASAKDGDAAEVPTQYWKN